MTRNNDLISNASPAEDDEPHEVDPADEKAGYGCPPIARASGPARAATHAAGRRGRRASTKCCARLLTDVYRIPAEAGGTQSA